MTDQMARLPSLSCDEADELAGAWGLHALDADEAAAVSQHLETCDRPHAELRQAVGAGAALAAALERIEPSPELRDRVMASIGAKAERALPARPRQPRGLPSWAPQALAGLAVAAVLVLAVWNVTLQNELATREGQLAQLAETLSASDGRTITVLGEAGRGVLVEGEGRTLLVADVQPPGEGMLYEMWLIGPDGVPVDVGTFRPAPDDEFVIVELERPFEGFELFAVTLERTRVDAPSSDPVLSGSI
jgi:anti-sigma-K factor RskA